MNSLSSIITFIKEKRKILISLFLLIGLMSSLVDVLILVQRPHDVRSKASGPSIIDPSLQFTTEFNSPKNQYKVIFDKRLWTYNTLGSRVVFSLNAEYGFARLDIIEGESKKDLDSLKDEILTSSNLVPLEIKVGQFKDKPSYLITYKEQILGEDTYYYQQIVKDNDKFIIFEKRAPQLGYNQIYLNNLLENVYLSGSKSLNQVKGISNPSTGLTTVELVDLIRPSVSNIVHIYCLEITNLQPTLSNLAKPKYAFCGTEKGSGFIVNENGLVATNGHVVKLYPEEALVTQLLYEGNKDFTKDLVRGIYLSKGETPTPNQIEDFYKQIGSNPQYLDKFLSEIYQLFDKKAIAVNISAEKYYINVGSEPVRIDHQKINSGDYINSVIPSSTIYTAKLVDLNYPNRYSYDAIINKKNQTGSDVALLQIDNPSNNLFPILELGNIDSLKEGADVVIAGYPILVEGGEGPQTAISYETSTKPTITRGIVSAIKQDSSGRKIIQTDASIDHGNSGGPAVDSIGQVIGIATFMVESQTGNFNFLRDTSDLKDLMSKNELQNNSDKLTTTWRQGLDKFRSKYYSQALKKFKQVESLSPAHPTVKEFIARSEDGIKNGDNLEGVAGFIKGENSNALLVVFGGISIVSFMSAGFLATLPLFTKNTNQF